MSGYFSKDDYETGLSCPYSKVTCFIVICTLWKLAHHHSTPKLTKSQETWISLNFNILDQFSELSLKSPNGQSIIETLKTRS